MKIKSEDWDLKKRELEFRLKFAMKFQDRVSAKVLATYLMTPFTRSVRYMVNEIIDEQIAKAKKEEDFIIVGSDNGGYFLCNCQADVDEAKDYLKSRIRKLSMRVRKLERLAKIKFPEPQIEMGLKIKLDLNKKNG